MFFRWSDVKPYLKLRLVYKAKIDVNLALMINMDLHHLHICCATV